MKNEQSVAKEPLLLTFKKVVRKILVNICILGFILCLLLFPAAPIALVFGWIAATILVVAILLSISIAGERHYRAAVACVKDRKSDRNLMRTYWLIKICGWLLAVLFSIPLIDKHDFTRQMPWPLVFTFWKILPAIAVMLLATELTILGLAPKNKKK